MKGKIAGFYGQYLPCIMEKVGSKHFRHLVVIGSLMWIYNGFASGTSSSLVNSRQVKTVFEACVHLASIIEQVPVYCVSRLATV